MSERVTYFANHGWCPACGWETTFNAAQSDWAFRTCEDCGARFVASIHGDTLIAERTEET